MSPSCRDFLAAMLETAPARPAAESALGQHLAGCESCSAALERAVRLRRAVAALPSRRAPGALDGLVVASTQAGKRQERAVAHLRAALRHDAPAHLEARLGIGGSLLDEVERLHAPAVLERLVEEELRDPQHALTRRYVARLQRLGPPATLSERVHARLAMPRRSALRGALLAGAALSVLVAAMWGWWRIGQQNLHPRFQVVYVDSAEELDPVARELLSGATGGLSELKGSPR
jgi:hypothetical protein